MNFEFEDHVETPDHMDLWLFQQLESLQHNNQIYIVENELNIFNNYDRIRDFIRNNPTIRINVVAHCRDQAIPHENIFSKIDQVFEDLNQNCNFKFVLIAPTPYHWNIDFSKNKNFLYVYYPEYNGIYWPLYKDLDPLGNRKIKKHFLCLNKRAEFLRQLLYYEFYNRNWLGQSYFSYLGENFLNGNLYCNESYENFKNLILEQDQYKHLTLPTQNFLTINQDNLLVDYQTWIKKNSSIDPTWKVELEIYKNSFCSVIIETGPTHEFVNLSEKTFRSIVLQHPTVVFSSKNTNRFLMELGLDYNLYNSVLKYWDTQTDFNRFDNFVKFLEVISKKNLSEINIINTLIQDKLINTRNRYQQLYQEMLEKQDSILSNIKAFLEFDQG